VIGPPVAYSCVEKGQALPNLVRPLYNDIMKGLTVCYTGFHDHQEMHRLYKLAQYMGGGMRRHITTDVTHVVAKTVGGSNYKVSHNSVYWSVNRVLHPNPKVPNPSSEIPFKFVCFVKSLLKAVP